MAVKRIFYRVTTKHGCEENIFQSKLEPLRKKQVIVKYFTQDELDLVLGDSFEKDSLDKNRPDQYWILNSNILIHLPNQ